MQFFAAFARMDSRRYTHSREEIARQKAGIDSLVGHRLSCLNLKKNSRVTAKAKRARARARARRAMTRHLGKKTAAKSCPRHAPCPIKIQQTNKKRNASHNNKLQTRERRQNRRTRLVKC